MLDTPVPAAAPPTARSPRWLSFPLAAAVALACLGLRLQAAARGPLPDDAYITFRYAARLAAGAGLSYNDGERVLGTTSPLFALLLAIPARLGCDVPGAALALSLVASALCCALLCEAVRAATPATPGAGSLAAGLAGGALLAASGLQTALAGSGLETTTMGALMLGSYCLLVRRRPVAGAALAGLVALARPEGLAWTLPYLGVALLTGRRRLAALAWGLAPLLAWVAFATAYFGSPVPQSAQAKLLQGHLGAPGMAATPAALLTPLGPAWLVAVLYAAAALAARREPRLGVPVLFCGAFAAAYALLQPALYEWYPGPLDFAFCLLAATVPGALWRAARERPGRRAAATAAALAALCLVLLLASRLQTYPRHPGGAAGPDPRYRLALCLRQHTRPGDTILVQDVGYVGYYNPGRRVVDSFGLVWQAPRSLVAAALRQTPEAPWLASAISLLHPEAIAFTGTDAPTRAPTGYAFAPDAARLGFRVLVRHTP